MSQLPLFKVFMSDDVLEAFAKITQSNMQGEIIHVGNDKEEILIADLAKIVFDIGQEEQL